MVYVVQDKNAIIDAIRTSRYVLYTIRGRGEKKLLRIKAGMIGFEREYDMSRDDDRREYEELLSILRMFNAIYVSRVTRDEEFLS